MAGYKIDLMTMFALFYVLPSLIMVVFYVFRLMELRKKQVFLSRHAKESLLCFVPFLNWLGAILIIDGVLSELYLMLKKIIERYD